jgi:hypothetical protein
VRGPWPIVAAVVVTTAACAGSSASSAAHRARATTPTSSATTTTGAALPCGGVTTVPAAVRASPVAGLDQNPTQYQVQNVSLARSDPTWARFDALPQPGQEGVYQGGSGLAHCAAGVWTVTDFGTAAVGCPGGAVAPPPSAVSADLGIDCP